MSEHFVLANPEVAEYDALNLLFSKVGFHLSKSTAGFKTVYHVVDYVTWTTHVRDNKMPPSAATVEI